MSAPVALQLYTLRELAQKDYAATVARVAEIGYVGVETAGFPGTNAAEASKLFQRLDLQVTSAHAPLPLGDKKTEVLETMAALGCAHLVCPWMDPKHYASVETIKALADTFNEAYQVAAANGLKLSIHNHDFEMTLVDGRPAYKILMDYLEPGVFFQVDTYWAQVAGLDPAEVVKGLGERAPLLHIKDGPADSRQSDMLALGEGVVDIPALVTAGKPHTEWLIVELDRCAKDMMEAVTKSYQYLVNKGLARGNK